MLCVAAGLRRLMSAQTLDVISDGGEIILADMQLQFWYLLLHTVICQHGVNGL